MATIGPYNSLRDYLSALEAGGHVVHVPEVDQDAFEATGLAYRLIDKHGWTGAPVVVFDRVKIQGRWIDGPLVINLHGRWEYDALAFGLDPSGRDSRQVYRETVAHVASLAGEDGRWKTIEPVEIAAKAAACKEVRLIGEQIDLESFAIIQSNPADGGRYINSGNVVLVDPERGRNVGTYRCQLKGPRKLGINPEINQHGWTFLMAMKERGEPFARAAVVLGTDPIVYTMSSSKAAGLGEDELAIAGGFIGKAVEVVRCETSDLLVPANAEMVIEGEIPFDTEPEGPFGEMYGYIGAYKPENFYMNVTTVTHRRGPVFVNQFAGVTRGFLSAPLEVTAAQGFRKTYPSVEAIHLPLQMPGYCFVSIQKRATGEALSIGRAVTSALKVGKITIVVDADVDIYDIDEVLHTVGARWQPQPATEIVEQSGGMSGDPSAVTRGKGSRIVIDATRQWPEEGGPEDYAKMNRECLVEAIPDIFERIDAKWSDTLKRG